MKYEKLKIAVYKKLNEFNNQKFQKREGTRFECYQDELPAMHALPAVPYEIATWIYGR